MPPLPLPGTGEHCQDVLFAVPREDAETLKISSAQMDVIPASANAPHQGSHSLWAASVVHSAGAQEHPEDKKPEACTWHTFLSADRSILGSLVFSMFNAHPGSIVLLPQTNPPPPMLSVWADMAQAQSKSARCFPHQPALSLLPRFLLQKHVFEEKNE